MQMELISDYKGNLTSKISNDFYFHWARASRIDWKELKDVKENEEQLIRAFQINSTGLRLQFRDFASITPGGKPKNLLATAFISKEDLELMLAEINKYNP